MNAFRISILLVAACIAPQLASAANRNALLVDGALRVTVLYDELDLSNKHGVENLYARLRGAARQVCTPFEGKELRRREAWKTCYNQALSSAVQQVNRDAVTALHQRSVRGDRAS